MDRFLSCKVSLLLNFLFVLFSYILSCSFKFKQNYYLANLVIAYEIRDSFQYMCRVLGSTSRIEPFRDTYCDKPENEQGHVSKDEADTDWLEPTLFPYNPIMLQANGSDRVFFAIHLLQTDPSVQVHMTLFIV